MNQKRYCVATLSVPPDWIPVATIAGFQSHAIEKKIKIKIKINNRSKIKFRIWEMKGDAYTKTLAKIQVRGIFRIRDIRRNVLPSFATKA